MSYVLDTSCLIEAWVRRYPPDVFPALWHRLDGHIDRGTLAAPDEVLHELERKADDLHDWAKQRPALWVPLDEGILRAARGIVQGHPRLAGAGRSRNQADSFVIAVAQIQRSTVVTEERGGTPARPKIPYICDTLNVRCISTLDLIRELGMSF